MNWTVPFFQLDLGEEELQAVQEVVRSNWLTTGPKIRDLETLFAAANGVPGLCATAVGNGTAALHLAMLCLDIGPGDEVICPSLTFVADANTVRQAGATPVFADIRSHDDWTIDPEDVARKITSRTKAILVVHLGGYPCRMDAILALAHQHDLRVIEDACHAPLAEWNGRKLGTIGDAGCFSFFSNKNMTSGEGGMIILPDTERAARSRVLRSHGMTTSSYERFKGHAFGYDVLDVGYNYRLDEIRAAIAIEQLKKLPEVNRRRAELVAIYRARMAAALPEVRVPFATWTGPYGYHIFSILLPESGQDRETVMHELKDRGIQTSFHYRPIHTFTAYRDYPADLPVTDAIADRILSLPLFPTMTDAQIDHVVDSLKSCLWK